MDQMLPDEMSTTFLVDLPTVPTGTMALRSLLVLSTRCTLLMSWLFFPKTEVSQGLTGSFLRPVSGRGMLMVHSCYSRVVSSSAHTGLYWGTWRSRAETCLPVTVELSVSVCLCKDSGKAKIMGLSWLKVIFLRVRLKPLGWNMLSGKKKWSILRNFQGL